jgi:hypothetical protein
MGTRQNAVIRDRRRKRLEEVIEAKLPNLTKERLNPRAADDEYHAAVRQLIVLVRAKSGSFPRIQDENISYGFRRNLYALKPIALCVLAATGVICVASLVTRGPHWPVALSVTMTLTLALVWLFAVKPEWVRQAGDTYAERLFEALDDPAIRG